MKAPMDKTVRFEIAPRTIGWILATIAGVWLLRELWLVVLLVVFALVIAGTFNPLVEWMEKHGLKRTLALVLLFFGSIIARSVLVFLTGPPIAVFALLLLVVCKVPNALSLALFAALVDVIPFVGGFLAAAFAILSALPRGLPVAIVVPVAMLIYMEFESRILVPKVYGHVLRLSPTAVLLALLAGGTLLGVMGALLALPIAAGLQMILEELRVEMPGDDSVDRSAHARNAK